MPRGDVVPTPSRPTPAAVPVGPETWVAGGVGGKTTVGVVSRPRGTVSGPGGGTVTPPPTHGCRSR